MDGAFPHVSRPATASRTDGRAQTRRPKLESGTRAHPGGCVLSGMWLAVSGIAPYTRGIEETAVLMRNFTTCSRIVYVDYSEYGIETTSEVSSALTITLGENVHPETVSS